MKKLFELLFGNNKHQGEKLPEPTFNSVKPITQLSFTDWCNELKVSIQYKDSDFKLRAKMLMNQYEEKNYKKFVKKLKW